MSTILTADVSRVLVVGDGRFASGGPFMVPPEHNVCETIMRRHPAIRMALDFHPFRPDFRLEAGYGKGSRLCMS
jgi:hypothetical protein